jgi:hypothetical protein
MGTDCVCMELDPSGAHCPPPRWIWNTSGTLLTKETEELGKKKTRRSSTLPSANPTHTDLGANPGSAAARSLRLDALAKARLWSAHKDTGTGLAVHNVVATYANKMPKHKAKPHLHTRVASAWAAYKHSFNRGKSKTPFGELRMQHRCPVNGNRHPRWKGSCPSNPPPTISVDSQTCRDWSIQSCLKWMKTTS